LEKRREDLEQKPNAVIIDEDMAFKNTMTSDFKKIISLALASEKITYLNYGNTVLGKLAHLTRLDLSFNKIEKIQNLEPLKMLQELDLSGNPISVIENLNLSQLKSLQMDGCRLRKIENLKVAKKLVHLSLKSNQIDDPSIQGGAQ
jgi:Leucine-rich repeat (LRR) protein